MPSPPAPISLEWNLCSRITSFMRSFSCKGGGRGGCDDSVWGEEGRDEGDEGVKRGGGARGWKEG